LGPFGDSADLQNARKVEGYLFQDLVFPVGFLVDLMSWEIAVELKNGVRNSGGVIMCNELRNHFVGS